MLQLFTAAVGPDLWPLPKAGTCSSLLPPLWQKVSWEPRAHPEEREAGWEEEVHPHSSPPGGETQLCGSCRWWCWQPGSLLVPGGEGGTHPPLPHLLCLAMEQLQFLWSWAGFTADIKWYYFRSLETTCEIRTNPALTSRCWKENRGNHLRKVKLCIGTFSGLRRSWIQFSFTWNDRFPFRH